MPSSTRGMEGESSGWTSSPSTARPSPLEKGGTHRVRRLPQEERHQGPRRRNSCLSSGQRDDREGERARVKEAHPSDGRRGGEGTPPEGQAQEEALSGPRGQELRHIPRQAVPPEEAHPCEHTKEEQEEASGETDDFRQACPEEDALHRGTVLQLDEIVQEDRHEVRQACLLVHRVHPHRLQPHPHEGGIEIGSLLRSLKTAYFAVIACIDVRPHPRDGKRLHRKKGTRLRACHGAFFQEQDRIIAVRHPKDWEDEPPREIERQLTSRHSIPVIYLSVSGGCPILGVILILESGFGEKKVDRPLLNVLR